MNPLFKFFSSLRLTVALLAFSMLLVLLATFAQVHWGVFEVQKRFFETFIAFWQYPAEWPGSSSLEWLRLPLPGGFLLGGLLVINLCCAHFRFFRASWRKVGIVLIHGGVVLLIISAFAANYFRQEYYMWINVDGQSSHIESFHDLDLVFIDHTDPKTDTVVSIPTSRLNTQQTISDPALPFTVKTLFYYPNSTFGLRSKNPGLPELPATDGVARNRDLIVTPQPYNFANEETNTSSAAVAIETAKGPVGKWLVSTLFDPEMGPPPFLRSDLPQTFTVDGHTWEVTLRPRRVYLPYTMHLDQFIHEMYPGTDVPKRFESHIHLLNPARNEDRAIMIYMNHPLRYEGLTFYQASFAPGDSATRLEVVRNPGWGTPYAAVAMVGVGMLIHFILSLMQHLRREEERAGKTVPASGQSPVKVPTP